MSMNAQQLLDWFRRPKRQSQTTGRTWYGSTNAPGVVAAGTSGTYPIVMSEFILDETFSPLNAPGEGGGIRYQGVIPGIFIFSAATSTTALNFPISLPAYGRVIDALLINDSPLVYTTATNMGIGIAAYPSDILLDGGVTTQNAFSRKLPTTGGTHTDNSTATTPLTLQIAACASNGTAAGSVLGIVRAALLVEWVTPLNSAPVGSPI